LGGRNSVATDINAVGDIIVGWSETSSGSTHAFLWRDGVMKDMGTLGGPFSLANGVNRGGIAVGMSTPAGSVKNHAFRYKNSVMEDLDRGNWQRLSSRATAINNAGVIVGVLGAFPDAQGEDRDFTTPFRWYQGIMTDLKIPWGQAMDVNPDGVITGSSPSDGGETAPRGDAWVWQNGVTTFLPEPTNGSAVSAGNAINPHGDVVGYVEPNCTADGCGPQHATLWKHN
jgi:probable HAF family extracellular repeat protein